MSMRSVFEENSRLGQNARHNNGLDLLRSKLEKQRILVQQVQVVGLSQGDHPSVGVFRVRTHAMVRDDRIVEFIELQRMSVVKWKREDDDLYLLVETRPYCHSRPICKRVSHLTRPLGFGGEYQRLLSGTNDYFLQLIQSIIYILLSIIFCMLMYGMLYDAQLSGILLTSAGMMLCTKAARAKIHLADSAPQLRSYVCKEGVQ